MYQYPLWQYKDPLIPLGDTYYSIFWAAVIYPCVVILFFTFTPKKTMRLLPYILLSSLIFIAVEYLTVVLNSFEYMNGWSLFSSFLFDIALFSILYIHYKKPPLAWLIIFIIVPIFSISDRYAFKYGQMTGDTMNYQGR